MIKMTLRNGYPKGDKSFMPEKIVGVLGGMGPEATVDFFAKVIEAVYTHIRLRCIHDA